MLSFSLAYGDELWHVVLYQWLIDNALTDRLLEVQPWVIVFMFLNLSVSAFSFKFQRRRNTFQHQRAVQRLQTGYSALMIASRVQKLPCHRKNLKSKDWLQIDGCATLLHTMCKHMMKSIILLSVLQKKEADERCSHNGHWISHFSAKIRLSEQNFSFNFLKTIFVLSD